LVQQKNHIVAYTDVITFHTYGLTGRLHSNHAVKILVASKEISISHNRKLFTAQGLIVKSDTVHKIKPHEGLVVCIYIDPESIDGTHINNLFKNVPVLRFDCALALGLFDLLSTPSNHITENEIKAKIQKTLVPLHRSHQDRLMDQRIASVTRLIKESEHCSVKFAELLELSSLSESRLIHLFKKEIGITIRKYTLWCRTVKAIAAMRSGTTIKEAAKITGFTDAAHFNRTFVAMYGVTPSLLTK
jgi:AraC-like DNA-binding protein